LKELLGVPAPGECIAAQHASLNPAGKTMSRESILQMVCLGGADGSMVYFDQHLLDYAGLSAEDLRGWGWLKLIHPEDASLAEQTWKEVFKSGEPYAAQYRIRRNDGNYYYYWVRATPVRDPIGQLKKWVATWNEIEDQKQTEQQVRELVAIVESSDDAIVGKTLEGIVTSWNHGAEHLFGYRAEEMIGRPISVLIPEDRLAEETQILARLRRGERVDHFETTRRRKDSTLVDVSVSISPILDKDGRVLGASKIARDITGRKRAELDLWESQRRFEGIVDSAMDAIISIDEAQRVVLFNTAAERMFGCAAAEALGQSLERFIPPRFRAVHRAHVRSFATAGVTNRTMGKLGSLTALRADGREFPIEASISQTEVGGDKLFTVILRDITERKEAEEALSRSESQLRALAARLQRVREEEAIRIARELHDQLGRCLTTIKMDITLIEQTVSARLTTQSIRSIQEKIPLMLEAIDETVQIVRKISTELRPGILDDLGLAAAIEWQAKDFQKRSGVLCILDVTEEDLDVGREQATAVFRIFQEIVTNIARHSKAEKAWIHLHAQDGMVVLEVEDNGVGISPEALSRYGALGLLGIRERAAIFGGEVEIGGIPGKGTTVIVRMPIDGSASP
jgi:PAS domain S-box-containing protein